MGCRNVAILCPIVGPFARRQLCESHGFLFTIEHPAVWSGMPHIEPLRMQG